MDLIAVDEVFSAVEGLWHFGEEKILSTKF